MNWDCVDLCCYINLKHKEDQKKNIENELKKIGFPSKKIKRIEATYRPLNGYQGNCLSHLEAINYAIDQKAKNLLVLEDDCVFTKPSLEIIDFIKSVQSTFNKKWDVAMLGASVVDFKNTSHEPFKRILMGGLEHAHLINGHYLETLANFYVWAYENVLSREPLHIQSQHYHSGSDILWQIMMKRDNWIVGNDFYAEQSQHKGSLSLPSDSKWIQGTIKSPTEIIKMSIPDHWDTSSLPFD